MRQRRRFLWGIDVHRMPIIWVPDPTKRIDPPLRSWQQRSTARKLKSLSRRNITAPWYLLSDEKEWGAKSTNIPFLLFHLGVAIAQISVAHRDARIDGLGFQLVVGFDGFREPADRLCPRKSDAGSIRHVRVGNDAKSVPVHRVHGALPPQTDQITPIRGAKDRRDK